MIFMLVAACGSPQVRPAPPPPAPVETWLPRPEVAALAKAQLPEAKQLIVTAPGSATGGVRLFVVERHDAPAVFLRWLLPGGRAWEFAPGPDKKPRWPEGTMQLTTELLTMGTKTHPETAFATQLARHGAQLQAGTLADAVVVQGQVLSHQLTPFLGLVREMLTEPTLDKGSFEGMKQRHAAALSNDDADADSVAARLARRLVYGPDHPYGSAGLTAASLGKIQRKHVLEAFKAAFALGGTDLIVVGDVDTQQLVTQLQTLFGATLAVTVSPPQVAPPNAAAAESCHAVDVPGAVQTAIVQANPGPARKVHDWPALQLANQVLGGSASSRLFSELREKRGLTYGVYSAFEGMRAAGQWLVSTDVATVKTGAALLALGEQMSRARREPPTADELGAARRFLAGQFALTLAASDDVADLVAAVQLYDLPTDTYARFLDGVQQVTAGQVLEATETWIGKAPTTTVLAGNVAAMRPGADATCARLVQRDAHGKIVRVLLGTDAEMGEAGRQEAFAAWQSAPEGLVALARYVKDTSHTAAFRAQALATAATGVNSAKVLDLGRKAADWRDVAHDAWPLLTDVLRKPARALRPDDDPQPRARAVLLAMANDKAADGKLADVDDLAAAAIRKAVADWAFAGMAVLELAPERLKALVELRLEPGDLARVADVDAAALSAWIAADVRRHEAARALVKAETPASLGALLRGYRNLYAREVQPDAEDLEILGSGERAETLLLLLDVHATLEKSDATQDVKATAATMQTIREAFDRLAAHSTLQTGRSDLSTLFDKFESHMELLLAQRNADDRWWAATWLVRVQGIEGLRKVLASMAVDDHYRNPRLHTVDPKLQLAKFARETVEPLGAQALQPHLFAALAGTQAMGKVIAVKALEALGDDGSVTALKTYGDETDVAPQLDLPTTFTLREMAAAAVDVRRLFHELDAAVAAGQMLADEAVVYKEVAFLTVDLTDKRLRAEVQRLARERLGTRPAVPDKAAPEKVVPAEPKAPEGVVVP